MEFGLFLGGFVHRDIRAANPNAEHDRLVSEVGLCEVADRHNWKFAWFTEHHFLEEYSHISANEVLMPWVLARTEQMHVGSGAAVPLRPRRSRHASCSVRRRGRPERRSRPRGIGRCRECHRYRSEQELVAALRCHWPPSGNTSRAPA